jgi:hypothetical protein
MRKYLIGLIMCLMIVLVSGCKDIPYATTKRNPENRFVTTGQEFYVDGLYSHLIVIKDIKTNVLYLHDTANGALTPWIDENGNPIKE